MLKRKFDPVAFPEPQPPANLDRYGDLAFASLMILCVSFRRLCRSQTTHPAMLRRGHDHLSWKLQ
jgi:hypothetical protein